MARITTQQQKHYVVFLIVNLFVCISLLLYVYCIDYGVGSPYPHRAYGDFRPVLSRRDIDNVGTSFNDNTTLSQTPSSGREPPPTCFRQVQFWAGSADAVQPTDYACPGVKCGIRYVADTSMGTMRDSHAVVLYHRSKWNWTEMHANRPPGQKWLFYSRESPIHTTKYIIPPEPYYNNSYDYTIAYREGATFEASYFHYDPTEPEIASDEPWRNWSAEKPRKVAWMAANCGLTSWRRRDFVKSLSRHIKVDMYGHCGNETCGENFTDCTPILQTHKFYLALENSECRNYITEKLWRNSLRIGVVPVVYGTLKEDYERVAPPNSFIHLHDFKSVEEVADYLHMVAANETLYNSFFEWKRHGSLKFSRETLAVGPQYLCQVVQRMLEDEEKEAAGIALNSSVPDLNSWWRDSCKNVGTGFPGDYRRRKSH